MNAMSTEEKREATICDVCSKEIASGEAQPCAKCGVTCCGDCIDEHDLCDDCAKARDEEGDEE